ncbi:Cytochrome c oxidase subunit 2 [Thiomonas arsenitoxydans]|uniref:Cytochrome c oxidase subunit 2 n=1 Tax=Thiomonas arsenitoxydans (strain DSM 22701 / CIP 110005 / 3As) TaxID=426114 RepID=D6CM23_THIA3|nr:cytochrome c oxidase subunit II [Thiomonas arsenitoxydans]CQR43517.1 Cytochrome c oxidase subunit 2 [Thiomonas sp. CB3]CAZ89601.1 putative cytochrome c oxidase, subunit II, CoxB [Thiomonas arsenitoxydans]CQR26853.1 Cytochrome c oxidase subunit 2 [Thiomonas arsenitoxydans]CQR36425.1 Cytochrome c oxidase subunit 2 [Thiomonas arsenitoxydans]CQR38775.1 Cytochrome c oxidase subunit 2 [Thiomonas arsenitoxydans]
MKAIHQIRLATAASLLGVMGAAHAAVESLPGGPQVLGLYFQNPVSPIAKQEKFLMDMMLWVCLGIGIVVFGAMFYSVYKHRKSKGAVAAHFHESTKVEIAWTIIPILIVIAILIPATRTVIAQENHSDSFMTVKATGAQWKWGYDYMAGPGKGISFWSTLTTPYSEIYEGKDLPSNFVLAVDHELVVPVDKKIKIVTTSDDVLHGFYVNSLGVQMDAIPGFVRSTWFTAEKTGTYYGQCAQICGKYHAFMPIVIKVVTLPEYEQWVAQWKKAHPDSTPPADGAAPSKT